VLSKIDDPQKRHELNEIWKKEIQKLHSIDENADQGYFQAWFRAKFADSMRPSKAGSVDQDFELIGSRFHNWFKDNHSAILKLNNEDDFYRFFKVEFQFFVNVYIKIKKAIEKLDSAMPHLAYIKTMGIADSLQDPLLLASVTFSDDEQILAKKLDYIARYIETYTSRRSVNFKKYAQSAIKYSMFNVIKLIRNNDIGQLANNLKATISEIPEKWDGITKFYLHGQNGRFVKHLLSRVSSYIDIESGKSTTYITYFHPTGKQFEIEHIWADKFQEHRDEFEQEIDFREWRNSIGALILLPNGTNQSFSSDVYEDKLKHYIKENTYAQTLNSDFYLKNPNFLKSPAIQKLHFKPHPHFKKADITERKELLKRICEDLWSENFYT
jgi:hypothetical protein